MTPMLTKISLLPYQNPLLTTGSYSADKYTAIFHFNDIAWSISYQIKLPVWLFYFANIPNIWISHLSVNLKMQMHGHHTEKAANILIIPGLISFSFTYKIESKINLYQLPSYEFLYSYPSSFDVEF